jgi:hypothetical protein
MSRRGRGPAEATREVGVGWERRQDTVRRKRRRDYQTRGKG